MTNRISSSARYELLIQDMQKSMYNYNKLTSQLSSGKKLTSITDDPIAAVNVLNTNKQLGQIGTFQTNVGMAQAELDTLDDLMALASGYLSSAWNRAVQANQQTYGKDSLKALKTEIDETIKTMVDLANTEYDDNYIFAGANTKQVAYVIDKETGEIIYQGTPSSNPEYARRTEVADGVFETINTTGDVVFGKYQYEQEVTEDGAKVFMDGDRRVLQTVDEATGEKVYTYEDDGSEYTGDPADLTKKMNDEPTATGVMGALSLLSKSIGQVIDSETPEEMKDGYDLMNSTLDMFANGLNMITTEQTKFGGVANRLTMTESTLETNNDNLSAYLKNINEVDYAKAVTDWMNAQYAYQASMKVASATMNMSLLNYL
ncbi:MAG: flagellar hook-associated protein FlgL [bacterium]|nr:flagellar hook-associated protein FlgL [bacterium]